MQYFNKQTFAISDHDSRRYVYQRQDELLKNKRENDSTKANSARMYEQPQLGSKCPVNVFRLYMTKLNPNCNRMWQLVKNTFNDNDVSWFTARPIGINTLQKFLQQICKYCQLDKVYTNHCLRVSTISILSEIFSENEVRAVSGHKTNSSLGIYKRLRSDKFADMSDHLNSSINSAILPIQQSTSHTIQPTSLNSKEPSSTDCTSSNSLLNTNFNDTLIDMPTLSPQEEKDNSVLQSSPPNAAEKLTCSASSCNQMFSNHEAFRLGNAVFNNYGTINFHFHN